MKEWSNKYNSFNSMKALVHVPYWSGYLTGEIPPPLAISVDPCGVCNLKCPHCNAAEILNKIHDKMSKETIDKLIGVSNKWGTKSFCIGGGGEPTLNNNTFYLIDRLYENKKQIALITNGTCFKNHIDTLLKCNYFGVSVDAATHQTWSIVKNSNENLFDEVIHNISNITGRGLEVTYKYLLLPTNVNEIYEACKLAKELGCNQFHLRPGSPPWFNKDTMYGFTERDIKSVESQIEKAMSNLEDKSFRIFGVTHKFNPDFSTKHTFNKCYACFTTYFISPNGDIGLCCDRRGDKNINLGTIDNIVSMWGSEKHKEIHESINVKNCPRCTLSHINEIFENVILEDKMFYNFF